MHYIAIFLFSVIPSICKADLKIIEKDEAEEMLAESTSPQFSKLIQSGGLVQPGDESNKMAGEDQLDLRNISNDIEVFTEKNGPQMEKQEEAMVKPEGEEAPTEAEQTKEEDAATEAEPLADPEAEPLADPEAEPPADPEPEAPAEPEAEAASEPETDIMSESEKAAEAETGTPAEPEEPKKEEPKEEEPKEEEPKEEEPKEEEPKEEEPKEEEPKEEEPKEEEPAADPDVDNKPEPELEPADNNEPDEKVNEQNSHERPPHNDEHEMPNDEPAKEEETNKVTESETAAKENNKNGISCFACNSHEDLQCPIKAKQRVQCPKINEGDAGKHNGCYTLFQAETNITMRGCVDDLAEDGLHFCLTNDKLCNICYANNCNDKVAPNSAVRLQFHVISIFSSLLITEFANLVIIK